MNSFFNGWNKNLSKTYSKDKDDFWFKKDYQKNNDKINLKNLLIKQWILNNINENSLNKENTKTFIKRKSWKRS